MANRGVVVWCKHRGSNLNVNFGTSKGLVVNYVESETKKGKVQNLLHAQMENQII